MNKKFSEYLLEGLIVFSAAVGITVLRFILSNGCVCHPESSAFLQVYTASGKSLLQMIFDPVYTDWGCYQARELSYLLDWCDVQFIKYCIFSGRAHFFSIVNASLNIVTAMVLYFGFRCWMPMLGRFGSVLLTLFFIVAPVNDSVNFFRSSKPAVSLCVAVIGMAVWSLIQRRKQTLAEQKGMWIVLSVFLLISPYFDRQGLFFVSSFCMACGAFLLLLSLKPPFDFWNVSESDRYRIFWLMIISAVSVAIATLYNLVICPELIYHFNGYYPSFLYQNMGSEASVSAVFNWEGGLHFVLNNIGFSFFRLPGWKSTVIGAVFVLLWLLFCYIIARKNVVAWLLFLTVAGTCTSIVVLANIMATRHPAILRPDVIISGYFQPSFVALIIIFAITFEMSGKMVAEYLKRLIYTLLIVSVATHLITFLFVKSKNDSDFNFYIANSPELIRCLNDKDRDPEKAMMPYSYLQLIRYFRTIKQ